ncbi:MAG: TetR/AcrR family transcriptional regulator [Candidatus Lokiarchaeota archaeon]|nr:TetR/AcrR family transcriptional regulator [Candidatus Lokiarchaeota archaeon]
MLVINLNNQKQIRKSRKQRETELRKKIILEATERLFLSEGYEKTTMDEIARQSEFSKGTLYNYFKSKDELYLAIGIKAYELICEYTERFTSKEKPGLSQLMAIGYAFYEFTKDYPAYSSIFHDIAVKIPEVSFKPKESLSQIEKEYLNSNYKYRDLFVKILGDAIKIKAIRIDKDPNLIGYILSTITSGIISDLLQNSEMVKRRGLDFDEIIDFTFEILAEGLKPREK